MLAASFRPRARLTVWIVLLAALAAAALARVAFAQDPTADFTVSPATPLEDQRAIYRAVLSRDYRGAGVQWDFDADPLGVFERRGATVRHTYSTPGEKRVRMRVILRGDVKAVVTKTVVMGERSPEPDPEPPRFPRPFPSRRRRHHRRRRPRRPRRSRRSLRRRLRTSPRSPPR